MNAPLHTVGPWRLNPGNETEIMDASGRLNVARAHCGGMSGIRLVEAEANARLIASAPDLLAALDFMVNVSRATPGFSAMARQQAEAAIAKATEGARA